MNQFSEEIMTDCLRALGLAAEKHRSQVRKGREASPYINHLIGVLDLLWSVGEVRDRDTLVAVILHDTLEDTQTSPQELEQAFGPHVLALVQEVTDDKSLPKTERKQLQVEHAPHLSPGARLIKLADKINNIGDVSRLPPADWPFQRRKEYLDWAARVVKGMRGTNPALEARFDQVLAEGYRLLDLEQDA